MILQELWREEMNQISMSTGRKEDGIAPQTGGTEVQSGKEVWRQVTKEESSLWVFPTSLGIRQ